MRPDCPDTDPQLCSYPQLFHLCICKVLRTVSSPPLQQIVLGIRVFWYGLGFMFSKGLNPVIRIRNSSEFIVEFDYFSKIFIYQNLD